MESSKVYNILRINGEEKREEEDLVVIEYPFTIFIDEKEILTLLCSPKSLKGLTLGFLYSEGFIKSKSDVKSIDIDENLGTGHVELNKRQYFLEDFQGKRTITSGCGKGTIFYNVIDSLKTERIKEALKIDMENIKDSMRDFNKRSDLFLKTGGVHSCGLYKDSEIIIFEEDIGRHNALDKILGIALEKDIELKDKTILTSGRISSEILLKIAKRGISTVVSRSAPTSLAVDMARELNINLIGFVRGEKLNIYNGSFPSL